MRLIFVGGLCDCVAGTCAIDFVSVCVHDVHHCMVAGSPLLCVVLFLDWPHWGREYV